MFIIKTNGVFELELRMRFCVPFGPGGQVDRKAMVNGPLFVTATNFGILESPPLRVRVRKEQGSVAVLHSRLFRPA
jgi:hypothetical protein